MSTIIVPADRTRTWESIVNPPDDAHGEILTSVLFITAAYLRPDTPGKTTYVRRSQIKRYYGRILWDRLENVNVKAQWGDQATLLGHLVFATYLRKVLEALPIVERE